MSVDEIRSLLERARGALFEGDLEAAERGAHAARQRAEPELRRAGRSVRRIGHAAAQPDMPSGADPAELDELEEMVIDSELLLAAVDIDMRRDAGALAHLRHLRTLIPGDGEVDYLEARLRLVRWELDEAEALLASCDAPAELRGAVPYHRAILAELRGRSDEAERLYDEAARLDPDGCPRPVRISEDEARDLLAELVHSFPADVRAALDSLRIDIVDVPDPAIDGSAADPFVLGLYSGVPIGEKGAVGMALPDRVRIFKRSIERWVGDRDELIEQLRITLLHEVGHHLGWDEEDLHERGLA